MLRVRIVVDFALVREGLRCLLATQADLQVAEAADLAPASSAPSVVLLDGARPDTIEDCRRLALATPRPRLLLINWDGSERFGLEALRAGARGLLTREAEPRDLFKAIRAVGEGQVWAPQQLVSRALDLLERGEERAESAEGLTTREQHIARLVADGLRNREIARRMGICEATVKAHLTHVFRKLGIRDRAHLMLHYRSDARRAAVLDRRPRLRQVESLTGLRP